MKALPRVKVCGLTTAEDSQAAREAGAEALGFVAVRDSPRAVGAAHVAGICADLPARTVRIGVFVDSSPQEVQAFAREASLTAVQLCGAERVADFSGFPLPILRRVAADGTGLEEIVSWRALAWGFVIDHPASAGGSGRRVDEAVARILAETAPCLLAGGLDEDNVAAAVRAVKPRGVDVSSRLERSPGRKDHARLRSFVTRAIEELP
ncbi:MAG: phosphoribosylanthranilate isomerase [Planctomycetota bacterium]|jgi:phosphoribosylanthranilate isomerase|nr:phosphoribosylanthranilate isomerase [Planctomycetota bacterium]